MPVLFALALVTETRWLPDLEFHAWNRIWYTPNAPGHCRSPTDRLAQRPCALTDGQVHTDFYWRPNSPFAIVGCICERHIKRKEKSREITTGTSHLHHHAHVGRPDLTAAGASEEQESILLLLCCQAVLVVYYPLLAHDAHHIASHAVLSRTQLLALTATRSWST